MGIGSRQGDSGCARSGLVTHVLESEAQVGVLFDKSSVRRITVKGDVWTFRMGFLKVGDQVPGSGDDKGIRRSSGDYLTVLGPINKVIVLVGCCRLVDGGTMTVCTRARDTTAFRWVGCSRNRIVIQREVGHV